MMAVVVLVLLVLCAHTAQGQFVQFIQSSYFPSVLEEEPANSAVASIRALARDSFGAPQGGTFSIPVTGDARFFNIENTGLDVTNTNVAILRNAVRLDRDSPDAQTQFTFAVTFTSEDSISRSAQVVVSIGDINDNSPQFVLDVFEITVFEELSSGTPVLNATAIDPDQTIQSEEVVDLGNNVFDTVTTYLVENGRIMYEITTGNELGHFQINPNNGTLSISPGVQLDVDQQDSYNFTVLATDGGGRNDTATVCISVLDSNDNAPKILDPRVVDLTLPEDTAPGYVIVDAINATDADSGDNAVVRFSITNGALRESFDIDETSGQITVSGPLDREVQSVLNLTVVARDLGVPEPLQDTIYVVIRLLDINDFTPQFTEAAYVRSIIENSMVGSSVAQILAIDLDEGSNGTITYSIIQGGEGVFVIDTSTGEIFTDSSLDRENVPSYNLVVSAADNPSNISDQLSAEVNVSIVIEDFNDNVPIFSKEAYNVSILDNVTLSDPLIQLTATDIDSGSNGIVTYRIEEFDPRYPLAFRIDENTGTVFRNRRLSFDNQSSFTYTIKALDDGPFRRSEDVQLNIIVHNVNENPPVFEEAAYNITIAETTPIGTEVLNVTAIDPDVGPIGEVRYRIVTEFNAAGSFGVNKTTGVLVVTSSLDFDFTETIFFEVEAYDGGFPEPFTDYTNVTVCLIGSNDEPPSIIFPEGFIPFVSENMPPEVDVVTLGDFTVDPDLGQGGRDFSFYLSEIYDPFSINDSFSLNETTGLIRSLRVFDRELQPQGVVIAIGTVDLENISMVTNITIAIQDMNDNSPYFERSVSVTVHEFLPPGTEVLEEYRARDEDIGSNADLRYNLYDGVGREMFSIDPVTSALRTAAVLNKTAQNMYNLTVIVMDQGSPQLFGFGVIYVEVSDSNDMVPVFSESLYNASFSESDLIGTLFFQVNATDSDIGTNAELQYFLAPNSSNSEQFRLDSLTGELFTDDDFDRENVSSLLLTIVAVDSGRVPHPLTGSATVSVSITDYNEFPPVFNESSYEAVVIENADSGTFVASVFASDEDADFPNNAVQYSLGGNRSSAFAIDPEVGVVTVSGEVDWEEGAIFNLTVTASDLADENPLFNTVDLMITVVDVNDRNPVFATESLNLSIPENTIVGEGVFVGTVRADDADSAGNNSEVAYSVLMDFTNGKFELDSETGQVTFVRGTLNRERRALYDLVIRATDHGDPTPLHTDATLIINVLDANDFDPVFNPDRYSASVEEAAPIGTSVITLLATDADFGSNADLLYTISDAIDVFEINGTSGIIYVSGMLDFEVEAMKFYSFEVLVSDRGGRNDTAHVEITVTDSNDLRPVFNLSEYSAVIQENLASGTTLLRVFAEDADTNPENAIIEYTLGAGEGSVNFGIDPQTGVVYANSYLNREEFSFYNLTVTANNSLSSYPLSAEVQLLVTVTDLNDMHPSFSLVVAVDVFENTTVGSILHTLRADDGDEGVNGTVTYTLLQPSELFGLNAASGELTLLRPLDYEVLPRQYMLPVMASDSGTQSLSNFTNVLVSVLDSNNQPPRFASEDYSVTVDSESVIGTSILQLDARDPDEGSTIEITLSVLSGNDLGLFVIAGDGTIRTAAALQSHAGTSFLLTVQAADPELSSEAKVTLYVQSGAQTALPFFNSRTYTATLSEAAQDGAFVTGFSGETGNEIGFDVRSEAFSISPTGSVTVANSSLLDYESLPLHQVTVSIRNSAGDMAYAILNVAITDENEHPPEFISDSFFVAIPETVPVNTPFFTAIAFDEDGESPADVITYDISLTEASIRSRFVINSRTGALSLVSPLRYKSGDLGFNLTVKATNSQTTPSLSTVATIEIQVLNGNSFNPVFDITLHTLRFPEGFPAGENILNVSATDQDDGSHGQVTYAIHGDHRYLDFRIETFTGRLYTNEELDYERQNVYTLDVVAWDGGNPGRFSVAAVEVFVEDLNDNTPIWDQELYSVSIVENATVGSGILQVLATDRDQEVITADDAFGNGHVTYSITQGDPANNFDVNPDTGLVSVASSLDRETYPEYNLTLNASDGGGLFANAYLQIIVHDSNDMMPSFLASPYSVGLSEDAEIGTLVLTVQANDTDLNENSEITYHFADTPLDMYDSSGVFSLNATTGGLRLEALVDREVTPLYTLDLIAVDMGDVQLTGTTQVLVNLLDINEFTPEFTQLGFSGEVYENEPQGTSILQVSAIDRDFGENSTIFYSIVSAGADMFDIAPETGIVSVAGPLDFEVVDEYELIIMATDAGPIMERLVNFTNISITILDRNDNPPIFSEESYIASISEGAVVGDLVLNVTASDADSGSNAELVFSLEFLSDDEARANFVIDSRTGTISLSDTSDLDRERTPSYDVIVNVADRGNISLQNAAQVAILVADINDNTPQFSLSHIQASVSENLPAATSVTRVLATDDDTGMNAALSYSIASTRNGDGSCLSQEDVDTAACLSVLDVSSLVDVLGEVLTVDSMTGEILTLQPVDREIVSVYLLELVAMDSGQPQNLTNTTLVVVNVLDQNDNAPTFTRDVYYANISEYLGSGQPVISVLAEDMDLSVSAEISYFLAGSDLFTINSVTGELFTASDGYDREMQDTYNLTVTATDAGAPSLSGSALVVVEVLDENDSPPVFANPLYTASIRENLSPGTAVIDLNATDADIRLNAELYYSIQSSSPALHFAIEPSSGTLHTTQLLDRELIDSYLVTIIVSDGGTPSLNSTTLVEVVVMDDNDSPPEFLNISYTVSVEENSLPDQPILRVLADDPDLGTNAAVFYSILGVFPVSNAFEIDQNTGDVFVRCPLDVEVSLVYNVTVVADNGPALPLQLSETVVGVAIGDVNDNAPIFGQVDYNIPYLESRPPGSVVVNIVASDLDVTNQNSALSYEITGGINTSLFNITTVDGVGVVSVAGILDRETEPRHVLEIRVFDSGFPQLDAMTVLTVDLLDANDNTPIFEQSMYTFTLMENLPFLTFIGQIRANDIDQQNISYSLNNTELFTINSVSGEIFSAIEFDREDLVIHSIVAVAIDGGQAVERSAEVVVNITILDVNDVTPSFTNSTYYVFLLENTTISTSVLTVEAEDGDYAENGSFDYSIVPGNGSSFFSINSTTGEVFLERELDRETQDLLSFIVAAADLGEPSLTGSAEVVVMVLDNNDNVPILNSSAYVTVLAEDTPPGTTVLYIGGSDMDIDENSDLTFFLSEDFSGTFTIGEKNGTLLLTGDLDYEFTQSYTFQVTAEDSGTPSLSSSSEVFIEIVDLNDNPPQFDSDVYQVSIPENIILGSQIFRIPATDSDSTSNGELRYSILSGNIRSAFSVDEVFGDVLVADYVDREITPSYSLEVRVVDQGLPQFTASATLEVTILDVNDHIPLFDSKTYSVLVPESSNIGTNIFTFTAFDLDIGTNANLTYGIIAGNENETFRIGSKSGGLSLANQLSAEVYPLYALSVLVSDNGSPEPLVDTATIRVIVEDVNEYPPIFPQSTYYINISQDAVVGSPVGYFIATDQDKSSLGALRYRLLEGTLQFEVAPIEGTVYVVRTLDLGVFVLPLEVTDGLFTTTINIHITVVLAVIPPVVSLFDYHTYLFSVAESAEIGSVVGEVTPANAEIFTSSVQNVFAIDPNGHVLITGSLDYETTPVYVLNIMTLGGTSNPPIFAVMTINILDTNDNPPMFESAEYRVTIEESLPPGSTLTILQAFDTDAAVSENSDFAVFLSSQGNEQGYFVLDPSSGVLSLSAMLDYEVNSSHVLTAVVTNSRAMPTLSSSSVILVSLVDVNDNSPQFSEMFYQVSIPESTPVGTDILTLGASDADSGTNSELVFSITHLSEPSTFVINQTSGVMATNTTFSLDMTTSFVVSVLVADRGNPQPLSAPTTVFVEVTPDNTNPPVFSNPNGYSVEILETLNIGGPIIEVSAIDDSGTGSIVYSIEPGGSPEGIFAIDPSTGVVSLSASLDFNTQAFHQLTIQAVDDGTPPRVSSVEFNVTVLDVNNHAPQFQQREYRVSIMENITIGMPVIQVVATDIDTTNITYEITVNYYRQGVPSFRIDSVTGNIVTTTAIDREMSDTIELLVSAIDSGYSIRRSTGVPVIITVLDLNDTPPVFIQSEFSSDVLRLLIAGKAVTQITAADADVTGDDLVYAVVSGDNSGVFTIDPMSGVIETAGRVPEDTQGYQLNITAFDGEFVSSVLVNLVPVDNGDFCDDGGLCTSVREVNCTFDIFPFLDCNPFCILPYALSLGRRVCLDYSCINSTLVPCIDTETCQPANMACSNTCPGGTSECPTTNLCHESSLSETCDDSNVTCLIGQSLVQRSDSTRYCAGTGNLPARAATCSSDDVYCEDLDVCMNTSTLYLCQPCPGQLLSCPNSNECVPDLAQCCESNEEFCDVLNSCIPTGSRCELSNVAPEVTSDLILLESLQGINSSDDGHVISVLLGDQSLDSQGEQLSAAIVRGSNLPFSEGEWQFALNSSQQWQSVPVGLFSETNALLLPSSALLRFMRRSEVLSGAVWLSVKLWDGNTDGFVSLRQDLVRSRAPSYSSTLPFTPDGPFSERTVLLTVLVHPFISPPAFSSLATHQFAGIREDVVFSENLGNSMSEVVVTIDTAYPPVLPDDIIEGFPESAGTPFEQLLSAEVRARYYDTVRRFNPTHAERLQALQSGQSPGVAVMLDPAASNRLGIWQIAFANDPKQFRSLEAILSTENSDFVLLNVSARLRFLPGADFCGITSILLAAWDGFWNSSVATKLDSGYIVSSPGPSLSRYNLNSWARAVLGVECTADNPLLLETTVQLSTVPYKIAHRYERLFTVLVDREVSSLQTEQQLLSNYLQIILQYPVIIQRLSPAVQGRTLVSFSVESDPLNFEAISSLINERRDSLILLNFGVLNISRDASYGPGAGCSGDMPSRYHGDHVNTLVSGFALDGEGNFLGMAVVGISPTNSGMWQYHRGNWTVQEDRSSQYNPDSNIWFNFPSNLSEENALLLHGNDRLRFLPHPHDYWTASLSPSIAVKAWDNSLGQFRGISSFPTEVSTVTVNTNPLVDTLQSLRRPIGLFSSAIATVTAARYGCDGGVNSASVHDQCCVCGGEGESCEGCDGTNGSNVGEDACDVCGGASSCLGCDLIPFSGTEARQCQVCLSQVSIPTPDLMLALNSRFSPSSFTDCRGDCHGNALLDDCNVCSGGGTAHDFNSDMDCAKTCFGNATIDTCGDCTGPGTAFPYFNQNLDCTGVCNGRFLSDSCGVCQLPGESGLVMENRDCSGECYGKAVEDSCGVCYGGNTNVSVDSDLDACRVCSGDNTTCVGCDGGVASGMSLDRCGQCGGNDCGCFVLSSVTPNRGPISGGTRIQLEGSGFFLNDTGLLGFQFDPDRPNCGAPMRFSDGLAVRIVCRFTLSMENEFLQVFGEPVNQSAVLCSTRDSAFSGVFSVQVSINDGPFSNPVEYQYDDYSTIILRTMTPVQWELNSKPTLSFHGDGFINSSLSCLLYNGHTCSDPPSLFPPSGYVSIPAVFMSASEVRCVLPPATTPCRVTVRLSFDGQESGRVESDSTDFIFTYRSTAPQVTDTYFLNDLSGFFIQFDWPAETIDQSPSPACVDIFDTVTLALLGGAQAACSWGNSRQDSLSVRLPNTAAARIHSPITFKNGVIQTRRVLYSFSLTNLTVTISPDSVQPLAVINGPDSIPFCGSVSFSGLHSQYAGYSGFEYNWAILVQDSTVPGYSEISQYLDSLGTDAYVISLDSAHFMETMEYSVQLQVVNSVGLRSATASMQLVKDLQPELNIVVLGSAERFINFGESLVVNSLVLEPECMSQGTLQFLWEMVRVTDERRGMTVAEDITDIKAGLQQVTVPASYFQENARYDLHLTVTSSSDVGRAELRVNILPTPLTVRIHGGNRTVSIGSDIVLDARNSTYSSDLDPTFTWICTVVGSLDACYNRTDAGADIPTPISLPRARFVSFPGSSLTPGLSYRFTLILEQQAATAEGTVVVGLVSSSVPMVEISVITSALLLSEEVTLSGFVFSETPLRSVSWDSVRQEGYGYVDLSTPGVAESQVTYDPSPSISSFPINPGATVSPGEINRVNLILSPQSLDPELSYIFSLTAVNNAGSSYAELAVKADPPPISATITPSPTSGVAMETEFQLAVSGALDSTPDSPFLYQFGFVLEGAADIQWISGVQTLPSITTVFPSGDKLQNFRLSVLAHIFDRKGGHSNVTTEITVEPNPSVSSGFYSNAISQVQTYLATSKDWSTAVSRLVAYLTEINRNTSSLSSQGLKEASLGTFLEIFDSYLSPSSAHYLMASSVLNMITSNQGIMVVSSQRKVSERAHSIAEWFKNATAIQSSFFSVPAQASGQPLFLQSSYPAPEREPVSTQDAAGLLSPWINLLQSGTTDSQVARMFVEGAETVSNVLCQQSSTGEQPYFVSTPLVILSATVASPIGQFNLSGHLVDFGSTIMPVYRSQACQREGVACSEACVTGITFPSDLSSLEQDNRVLQLSDATQQKIVNEIAGSNPQALELISEIVSVSVSIPSQDAYLTVQDLATPIQVLIPVPPPPMSSSNGLSLCIYREVGGGSGFESYDWLVDNTTSPTIVEVDTVAYYVCLYDHLTEFAVGLLPPPVITDPPTEPPTTLTTPTTMATTPTTRRATMPPVSTEPASESSPVGAIAAVVIIILIVGVVVGVVVILACWWHKKKRKVKVAPDESTTEKPVAELLRAGPLTPAESKIPMDIIQCLEEGKRERLGNMSVLPSIRLRELRFEVADKFPSLKNKPFYFLTRQLCDIDPTTEQQQFVSIVFGDKPIFVREVTADNLQSKKHFCVCGNAAQFECSNCSSQGYCSEQCQHSHWAEKHQKECSRLSERRRRSDVLYTQQNTSAFSTTLSPISETPLGLSSPTATSPGATATTPTNWKSFMGQKRVAPQQALTGRARALSVPARNATSLGSLARNLSIPQEGQAVILPHASPTTRAALGPLRQIPLPASSTLPPGQQHQRPSLSRIATAMGGGGFVPLSPLSPQASSLPERHVLQSPLQPSPQHAFFSRPQPHVIAPPQAPVRHLSITSVGSDDFAMTTPIRSEPFLESDEDDYDSSDTDSSSDSDGATRQPRGSSGSRPPPSLAVRRRELRESESSSSSEEEGSPQLTYK